MFGHCTRHELKPTHCKADIIHAASLPQKIEFTRFLPKPKGSPAPKAKGGSPKPSLSRGEPDAEEEAQNAHWEVSRDFRERLEIADLTTF